MKTTHNLLLASILLTATATVAVSEEAVYLTTDDSKPRPSLLRQWTDPPPKGGAWANGSALPTRVAHISSPASPPAGRTIQPNPPVAGPPAAGQQTQALLPSYGTGGMPPVGTINPYGNGGYSTITPSISSPQTQAAQPATTLPSQTPPSYTQTPSYTETPSYAAPSYAGTPSYTGTYGPPTAVSNPVSNLPPASAATIAPSLGYGAAISPIAAPQYPAPSAAIAPIPQTYTTPAATLPAPSAFAESTPAAAMWAPTQSIAPPAAPASVLTPVFGATATGSGASCQGICNGDPCGPQVWFQGGAFFGWINGYNTPALLTRSPVGTGLEQIGRPDSPMSTTVLGGGSIGDDLRVGTRLTSGIWFGTGRKVGFQTDLLFLGGGGDDFRVNSTGNPIYARPFYNTAPLVQGNDAQVLALQGVAEGSFQASSSGRIVSVGPAFRFNLCCCSSQPACPPPCDPCDPCATNVDPFTAAGSGFQSVAAVSDSFGGGGCGSGGCGHGGGGFFAGAGFASRVDLLVGYRYFQLQEDFRATEKLYPTGLGNVVGSYFELDDRIDTQNDFHGLELGAIWQLQRGRSLWDFGWSAAFGNLTRRYRVNGTTEFFASDAFSNSYDGGFLVRPENIGSYEDSKFTVLPQARIGWGYCLCNNLRLNVGYSALYLDDAFRPGSLMTTSFNGQTLGVEPPDGVVGSHVGPTSTESVLLHALSLGVSLNY